MKSGSKLAEHFPNFQRSNHSQRSIIVSHVHSSTPKPFLDLHPEVSILRGDGCNMTSSTNKDIATNVPSPLEDFSPPSNNNEEKLRSWELEGVVLMLSIGWLRVKWEVWNSGLSIHMCRPRKCHPFLLRIAYKLGKNWTEELVEVEPRNWIECFQGVQECSWGSCFCSRYGLCDGKTLNFKLSSWYL